jgi:hypothetical protein
LPHKTRDRALRALFPRSYTPHTSPPSRTRRHRLLPSTAGIDLPHRHFSDAVSFSLCVLGPVALASARHRYPRHPLAVRAAVAAGAAFWSPWSGSPSCPLRVEPIHVAKGCPKLENAVSGESPAERCRPPPQALSPSPCVICGSSGPPDLGSTNQIEYPFTLYN